MLPHTGILLGVLALSLVAGTQENPPSTPLQDALRDTDPEGRWNYNDPAAGFNEARSTGKPLLLVFR